MAFDLFSAILVLLHILYGIYLEARRLFNQFVQYLLDISNGPSGLKAELDYIREGKEHIERCGKSVTHLVIILGNESISVKDLVKITLWSQAAGVSYVSFYDHTGHLKRCKSALDEALLSACEVKTHIPKINGYRNGVVGKIFPHVMLFDISDGKGGIVRVAQQLCEKALGKELKPSSVDIELLDECIIKEAGVPEPELAMYCGDICSTYGFLPWHLRLTEFLPLRSHHNLSVQTFVSLLRRYSKCEQRLGA